MPYENATKKLIFGTATMLLLTFTSVNAQNWTPVQELPSQTPRVISSGELPPANTTQQQITTMPSGASFYSPTVEYRNHSSHQLVLDGIRQATGYPGLTENRIYSGGTYIIANANNGNQIMSGLQVNQNQLGLVYDELVRQSNNIGGLPVTATMTFEYLGADNMTFYTAQVTISAATAPGLAGQNIMSK